jgi:hypothetical protein
LQKTPLLINFMTGDSDKKTVWKFLVENIVYFLFEHHTEILNFFKIICLNSRNNKCCEFSTNVFIIKLLFLFGKEGVPTSSFQVHPNVKLCTLVQWRKKMILQVYFLFEHHTEILNFFKIICFLPCRYFIPLFTLQVFFISIHWGFIPLFTLQVFFISIHC